jgi:hypothetical protein
MAVESLGKLLLSIGIITIVIGAALVLLGKATWFGRLPGDIVIRREGFSIYIPIITMIIFSAFLTLLFNLIGRK